VRAGMPTKKEIEETGNNAKKVMLLQPQTKRIK
jgi:hypothetical protein